MAQITPTPERGSVLDVTLPAPPAWVPLPERGSVLDVDLYRFTSRAYRHIGLVRGARG